MIFYEALVNALLTNPDSIVKANQDNPDLYYDPLKPCSEGGILLYKTGDADAKASIRIVSYKKLAFCDRPGDGSEYCFIVAKEIFGKREIAFRTDGPAALCIFTSFMEDAYKALAWKDLVDTCFSNGWNTSKEGKVILLDHSKVPECDIPMAIEKEYNHFFLAETNVAGFFGKKISLLSLKEAQILFDIVVDSENIYIRIDERAFINNDAYLEDETEEGFEDAEDDILYFPLNVRFVKNYIAQVLT